MQSKRVTMAKSGWDVLQTVPDMQGRRSIRDCRTRGVNVRPVEVVGTD
jgi:hypothetical protein